jgi:hypothetical protein
MTASVFRIYKTTSLRRYQARWPGINLKPLALHHNNVFDIPSSSEHWTTGRLLVVQRGHTTVCWRDDPDSGFSKVEGPFSANRIPHVTEVPGNFRTAPQQVKLKHQSYPGPHLVKTGRATSTCAIVCEGAMGSYACRQHCRRDETILNC